MGPTSKCFLITVLAQSLYAQSDFNRHNFTFGLGAAQPRGELRNYFEPSFAGTAGYGFRFARFFQLDAGFEGIVGAARVRDFLPTQFGDLRIRDYEFLIPFGGRVVMPLGSERVRLTGGGGGAFMRYTELLQQPFSGSGFNISCAVCAARSGWASYAAVGADASVDRDAHFRIGAEARVYRGHTEGDPLGDVPPLRTRDRWLSIYGTFTLSF